jgi:hypothetical protein
MSDGTKESIKLTILNLVFDHIRYGEACSISESLKVKYHLPHYSFMILKFKTRAPLSMPKHLRSIHHCQIGNEGVSAIARALKMN